jgi:hypothetical protein
MNNIDEFYEYFIQTILSDAESRGMLRQTVFFEKVCEDLVSIGDLTKNYAAANYQKIGIEVSGHDFDEERKMLTLLVHQYYQEDKLVTLTKKDIDTKFKRVASFFKKSIEGLYKDLEETSEAHSISYQIYRYHQDQEITRVRFLIISDGKSTRTLGDIPSGELIGIPIDYRVIDLKYLFSIYQSENSSGDFEVSNVKLPCLDVKSISADYQSYLTVLPGELIIKIYEEFGQKLFEQNVRTFLQFRGNVNKGLRNTIKTQPEMFFAYNNGLTATASRVDLDKLGRITTIHNFQIVNGAQTTSAIYAAHKNQKQDISDVFVQMKLSVVNDKDKQDKFVARVSEYANTQNRVSKSDFFSNSPFHKEFKAYSKRIWVSATGGSQRRTKWFYERVRGEYLNEQAYLTQAKKKSFQLEHPRYQMVDKTFLAKSENSWLQKPHIVSKGAQYSFKEFADSITTELERNSLAITENYFKDAISRVILFRAVEKMISNAGWYAGGFRANAVTYSIAYLSFLVKKTGAFLDFSLIWDVQNLPQPLEDALIVITEKVYSTIIDTPDSHANVTQWCKQPTCWEKVKNMSTGIQISSTLLIDKEEKHYIKLEAKKEKKLIHGIEIQSFVVKTPAASWQKLFNYYEELKKEKNLNLSENHFDLLRKIADGRIEVPSEKQAQVLYALYKDAEGDAFII